MKTILVPTDFSDNATNALHYAGALGLQTRSRLVLVYAIAHDVVELPGNPFALKADTRLEPYYLGQLEALASHLRSNTDNPLQVDILCVHGSILEHLNELVISYEADLVVMGTKGAHHLVQKLLGTNTAKYIQQAVCPVLAVPLTARYQGWKKIGYAADFENSDTVFLHQLFRLTQPLNAEVCIFNIKSDEQLDLVADNHILREIKKNFPENRYSICQMKEQQVATGIRVFIKENQMDVLALGVHQHDFLQNLFQDNISANLAFETTVPLLALPEKPYRHLKAEPSDTPALRH